MVVEGALGVEGGDGDLVEEPPFLRMDALPLGIDFPEGFVEPLDGRRDLGRERLAFVEGKDVVGRFLVRLAHEGDDIALLPEEPPLPVGQSSDRKVALAGFVGVDVPVGPVAIDLDRLLAHGVSHRVDCLFVASRLLVVEAGGRLFHLGSQIGNDFLDVPVEEALDLGVKLLVGLLVDLIDARGEAKAHMVIKTRPGRKGVALPGRVKGIEEIDREIGLVGGRKGAEIELPLFVGPPLDREPGILLAQGDVGIVAVVDEHHVVARDILLDEVHLEDEGLLVTRDANRVEAGDVAHHGRDLTDLVAEKILGDPLLERLGLPDVDDLPGLVFHEVAAGAVRKEGDEAPKFLGQDLLHLR